MGLDDKIKNAAENIAGKAKEATGKATNNERLEAEGQADQTKAHAKQAGENVKDAFKYVALPECPAPRGRGIRRFRDGCRGRAPAFAIMAE